VQYTIRACNLLSNSRRSESSARWRSCFGAGHFSEEMLVPIEEREREKERDSALTHMIKNARYRRWKGHRRVKCRNDDDKSAAGDDASSPVLSSWPNWRLTYHSIADRFCGARGGEREGEADCRPCRAFDRAETILCNFWDSPGSQSRADVPRVTGAVAGVPSVRP